MSNEKQQVKDTFMQYSDTFAKLDPNALAPFYHLPVILIDTKNVFFLNSEEDILKLLTPMIEGLKAVNYDHSEINNLSGKILSDNTGIVSGIGSRFKKDGSEMGKFGFTYTLRKTENGWKIIAGVVHDSDTTLQLE